MYRWIPFAFVRIAIFYCIGVVFGICVGSTIDTLTNILITLASVVGFGVCVLSHQGRTMPAGMLLAVALISTGTLNVLLSNESRDDRHAVHIKGRVTSFEAIVTAAVQDRPKTWRYEVTVHQVLENGVWRQATSRTLLYIQKDSSATQYRYGDRLIVRGSLARIQPPLNPGEFDLQAYQSNRQVYFQAFVATDKVYQLDNEPPSRLMGMAIQARLWAEGIIDDYVQGARARAIASAFVLGITDGLDGDLMGAYASTGAMHVLSVSGLHVGIVYWLLLMLFRPLGKHTTRWPLLAISLVVLWSYAFVTGLSASVLRAVVMFSFASIARAFNYKINIYNILAATVCVLLTIDPFMINSVGFQLSFVAVLGIVAVQPRLYQMWEPTWWLWDEIWKLISVSVAAQIATLPLCLLYFHQFPNYFLLANLFIVPGSFVVLLMGMSLLAVSAWDEAAGIIGKLLEILINFLNQLIFLIEKLPGSVIKNIFITPFQFAIMTSCIAMVVIWVETRSRRVLIVALLLIAAFPVVSWINSIAVLSPRITVYATKGATAVDMIANNVTLYMGSTELANDSRRLLPNRVSSMAADNIQNVKSRTIFPGCEIYVWQGLDIVRIYGPIPDLKESQMADLVIISNNATTDLKRTIRSVAAPRYVIDGSNHWKTTARLLEQGAGLPLQIHSVIQQGALELTF
ncbi:MAG: ComEC/Rec2 family competence protein [Chryseolinea sp.]